MIRWFFSLGSKAEYPYFQYCTCQIMFSGKVRSKSVYKKDIQVSIISDDYIYDFVNEIHNRQMKLFNSFSKIPISSKPNDPPMCYGKTCGN